MSGRQRWRAIGVRAALASAFLIAITVAVAYVATEARWFSPPYGAFGKQLAWALGIPEGAYNFDVVIPGRLYRSALPDARLVERLRQVHGVERLVSLAGPFESHQKARDLGIDVSVFHWRGDSLPPAGELDRVLDIIDEGEPVLVHCFHGQNRAGYAVAAYRVMRQGWTWDDAMGEMLSHGFRRSNLDNQGLHRALKELLGGS